MCVCGGGGGHEEKTKNRRTDPKKYWVFPIIAPQLSGQITYSPPPNHGKYNIMGGGLYFHGGLERPEILITFENEIFHKKIKMKNQSIK